MYNKRLSKEEIRKKYQDLLEESDISPQRRGYIFEEIIKSVLENELLDPKASYKSVGEQIDGSFFWEGRTFLLEAKWVQKPIPASTIYAFKGKLDGKFHTTSGVFLSKSGYSDEAEDALKFGKSLNVLLFNGDDIGLIFKGDASFLEVLKFKIREAGDTGSLLVPYQIKEQAKALSQQKPIETPSLEEHRNESGTEPEQIKAKIGDLLVFVEGESDIPIVTNFINPISERYFLSYRIEPLHGSANIHKLPALISSYGKHRSPKAVIIVLDDDQLSQINPDLINNLSDQIKNSASSVRVKFLFLNEGIKTQLNQNLLPPTLTSSSVYYQLEGFIDQIASDYYDPIVNIPQEVLYKEMKDIEWDFANHSVIVYDRFVPLNSLEDLVEYLEESMVQEMEGEISMGWLKENQPLNYETEILEFLYENYSDQLSKLGWDIDNL